MKKKSAKTISTATTSTLQGFAPLEGENPEILVLGTFPGRCSLYFGKYYADFRNSFRRIIEDVFNDEKPFATYDEFETCLKNNRIALWDVYESCERDGSADNNILNEKPNDLNRFLEDHKSIRKIIFNGGLAAKDCPQLDISRQIELCTALSTSSANAKKYDDKLAHWKNLLK